MNREAPQPSTAIDGTIHAMGAQEVELTGALPPFRADHVEDAQRADGRFPICCALAVTRVHGVTPGGIDRLVD